MLLCTSPIYVRDRLGRVKEAGCGKCEDCLRKKRNEWVQRLLAEWRYSACTKFVTLTYDDAHLPIEQVGEDEYRFTVNKRDIQLFLKRFRKLHKVRYFLVSEFGDATHRPHYHALFFFDEFLKNDEVNLLIQMSWDAGWIIDVSDLESVNGLRYVCKYLYKQQDEEKSFMLCSRNPAIGMAYVDKWKDRHIKYFKEHRDNFDTFGLQDFNGSSSNYSLPLCRYLREKIFDSSTKLGSRALAKIDIRGTDFRKKEIQDYCDKYNCKPIDFLRFERSASFQQNHKLKNSIK